MAKTVVGLYDDITIARDAVRDLVDNGFDRANISLAAYDATGEYARHLEAEPVEAGVSGVAAGAGIGAVVGGLAGLLVGMGAVVVPGIGPLITAGTIATALLGAGTGAAVGGLIGALVDMGIPEEEAEYYAEAVRRGGTLVAVQAPEPRVDEAVSILERYDPVDLEERIESWRERGWTGYDETAEPMTETQLEREREYHEGEYEPLSRIPYEDYDAQFQRHYETVYGMTEQPYRYYQPAYLYGYELAMSPRYRDRDWEEIETEARREWEETHDGGTWNEFKDAVRGAWYSVQTTLTDDYEQYEPGYRVHYEETYADTGRSYEYYAPGYRYGYDLAWDEDYRDMEWEEIETEVRSDWEEEHDTVWEEIKETVREGWQAVQDALDIEEEYRAHEPTYRAHYEETYAGEGRTYAQYEPAYRYGHDLAWYEEYEGQDWQEIEAEARSDWEAEQDTAWEEVKEAVREGWQRVQDMFEEEEDDYHTYEPAYRRHYGEAYAAEGESYDTYEPAYRYGYDLACEAQYRDRDWEELESEVQSEWEEDHDTAWEEVKEAVREGWQRVKNTFQAEEQEYSERYEPRYREHYEATYAEGGRAYEDYAPAYRYGYEMAWDEDYQDMEWEDVEPEARGEWEAEQEGAWEEVKETVREGWQAVQDALDMEEETYGTYQEDYRRHYEDTYPGTGYPYEQYEPAYRYGYDLARNPRYRNREWEELEPEAEMQWEERRGERTWEQSRAAVRYGYEAHRTV